MEGLDQASMLTFAWLIVAAGFGGFTSFLAGLRAGEIVEPGLRAKFLIEVAGGAGVGAFLTPFHTLLYNSPLSWQVIGAIAFVLGLCWAKVVQFIRNNITEAIRAVLVAIRDAREKEAMQEQAKIDDIQKSDEKRRGQSAG